MNISGNYMKQKQPSYWDVKYMKTFYEQQNYEINYN
jgi:hypothetical protein